MRPIIFELMALLIVVAVSIGGVATFAIASARRRKKLAQAATELGLGLSAELEAEDQLIFEKSQLAANNSPEASNVIVADSGELRMVLFDFSYKTGSGENSGTARQSVVLLTSKQLLMPPFHICPDTLLNRLASVFGSKDIKFEDDPEFSKCFSLKSSEDESAVRAFFTPKRRRQFLNYAEFHMESLGNALVYYRSKRRWKSTELKDVMKQALEITGVLSVQQAD